MKLNKYTIRKCIRSFRKSVLLFFSLPSVWVSFAILISAIISILISIKLHYQDKALAASVFSNIFAGLTTGFALSVLGSVKAVYCANKQQRINWLEGVHKQILDLVKRHRGLLQSKKMTDKAFFNECYDTFSDACQINDKILFEESDKEKWVNPPKYFLKHYKYSAMDVRILLEDMHEQIQFVGMNPNERWEDTRILLPIVNRMLDLNSCIVNDIEKLKIKLASAQRSFI